MTFDTHAAVCHMPKLINVHGLGLVTVQPESAATSSAAIKLSSVG